MAIATPSARVVNLDNHGERGVFNGRLLAVAATDGSDRAGQSWSGALRQPRR